MREWVFFVLGMFVASRAAVMIGARSAYAIFAMLIGSMVVGLVWYVLRISRRATRRVIVIEGQRFVLIEDQEGAHLEPMAAERSHP